MERTALRILIIDGKKLTRGRLATNKLRLGELLYVGHYFARIREWLMYRNQGCYLMNPSQLIIHESLLFRLNSFEMIGSTKL